VSLRHNSIIILQESRFTGKSKMKKIIGGPIFENAYSGLDQARDFQ
jgi:hypothetical protein